MRAVVLTFLVGAAIAMADAALAGGEDRSASGPAPAHSLRIASPAAGEVPYGPVRFEAVAAPAGGAAVLRVELFADGVLLARVRFAPFAVRWDAGSSMASHVLRAVATFSDGSTAEDLITTRGFSLSEHEIVEASPIDHVELLVSVTDEEGESVRGLTAGDFRVRDGSEPAEITEFQALAEREDLPLSLTILVDKSGSMRDSIKTWREACLALLESLRPIDQIRVTAFAGETRILQDFTRDFASLASSLDDIGLAGGETGLFRALLETTRDMRGQPGRKAIIVLTDGLDTDFSSPSGPITAGMFGVLRETARLASRAGVTVFVILPRPPGRGYLAVQDLALQTGGGYMYPSGDLGALMRKLGARLLGSYLLGYDVERAKDPDRRRKLEVVLSEERASGHTVRTAMGAYGRISPREALLQDLDAGSPSQRERAVRELGRLAGDDVAPRLIDALRDPAAGVRIAALESLAVRREPGALEKVADRLHDADVRVRRAALEAVAAYGVSALPVLLEESERRGDEGEEALRALGGIGSPAVLPRLGEAMRESGCGDRAAAVDGAGNLLAAAGSGFAARGIDPDSWTAQALDLLVPGLEDSCRNVSEAAAIALGRLGRPEALPALLALAGAGDPPPRLREVIEALGGHPGAASIEAVARHLDGPEPVRGAARRSAAILYGEAVRAGADPGREEAIRRLRELGGEEAHDTLTRLLDELGGSSDAEEWLGRIRSALESLESGGIRESRPTER